VSTSSDIASSLAPAGRLRVAINLTNAVLARRDPDTGEIGGVSMALARGLAEAIGVGVEPLPMQPTAAAIEALAAGTVDIAFLAIEPARAERIAYSNAYMVIEGAYLGREDTRVASAEAADRAGIRIAVARRSAHDLFLSRTIRQAALTRTSGLPESMARLTGGAVDLVASVRQSLEAQAAKTAGLRMVPGAFTQIRQAIGLSKERPAALDLVNHFLEEAKASGLIAAALADSGQTAAAVAPPGP
jgi:polar amino acid transport system substrate-binding protein